MVKLSVKGLESFVKHMKQAEWKLPNGVDQFMTKEARALMNDCKQASPYPTFKKRWFSKTRKGKGKASIWKGVFNKAPHLHLVNDGHKQIGHKPDKKYLGKVEGKHFLDAPVKHFEKQYEIDLERFLDSIW